jgi:hypothetical protein
LSIDITGVGIVAFYRRHVILYTRLQSLPVVKRVIVRTMFRHAFQQMGGSQVIVPVVTAIVGVGVSEVVKEVGLTRRHNISLTQQAAEAQHQRNLQLETHRSSLEHQAQEAQKQRELELRKLELGENSSKGWFGFKK